MKILRVEDDEKRGIGCFMIWVWARDDDIWKDRAYSFKDQGGLVYFLFGGQESGKRLIGEAESKDDAIKKAEVYLEAWLRYCGAID